LDAVIPALNECLIVQSSVMSLVETAATTNSASCTADISGNTAGRSKCTIRQSSRKGNNYAQVSARSTQRGGGSQPAATQTATQNAEITQVSDSGDNTAKISQTVQQELTIGEFDDPSQKQEAHQTLTVTQTSGSGNNSSDVQQVMGQVENASTNATTTQEQNTDTSLGANQDATVTQTSTTGRNTQNLGHGLTQRQFTQTGPGCVALTCTVTQKQGNVSGGQRGRVTQTTGPVVITSIADLNEDQQQSANTAGVLVRSQIGPQDCCATQFGGTTGNMNQVFLKNTQRNDPQAGASQTSRQRGHCQDDSGAFCSVDWTYVQNGRMSHFFESGVFVEETRNCNGATPGDPCMFFSP
jgi:hypothetical protein